MEYLLGDDDIQETTTTPSEEPKPLLLRVEDLEKKATQTKYLLWGIMALIIIRELGIFKNK